MITNEPHHNIALNVPLAFPLSSHYLLPSLTPSPPTRHTHTSILLPSLSTQELRYTTYLPSTQIVQLRNTKYEYDVPQIINKEDETRTQLVGLLSSFLISLSFSFSLLLLTSYFSSFFLFLLFSSFCSTSRVFLLFRLVDSNGGFFRLLYCLLFTVYFLYVLREENTQHSQYNDFQKRK